MATKRKATRQITVRLDADIWALIKRVSAMSGESVDSVFNVLLSMGLEKLRE